MFPHSEDAMIKLTDAGVAEATAKAYAQKLDGDSAVMLINATYKPLGAARIAREMFAEVETVNMGNLEEENTVKTKIDKAGSILKDHPRFTTLINEVADRGPITGAFGMSMLKPHRTKRSAMRDGGRRMSRAFWPMPLVKKNRNASSAISGGRHMSKFFWPMPLIISKPRRSSVIRDGDHPISRLFGWSMVSSR